LPPQPGGGIDTAGIHAEFARIRAAYPLHDRRGMTDFSTLDDTDLATVQGGQRPLIGSDWVPSGPSTTTGPTRPLPPCGGRPFIGSDWVPPGATCR
jgi:hypothetical protein